VPRPIARHNINLTTEQLGLLLSAVAGRARVEGGGRAAFEAAFAEYLGVRHVLALDSARLALALALRALKLAPGARVVLPEYCFFTLPLVVRALGLAPVFAAVDPATHAIDPERLAPTLRGAAALVLIHPFGQPAAGEAVAELCRAEGAVLVEDPSQSTGAALRGHPVGTLGRAATFSLVSGKNLQAFGGGLLATDDDELFQRIQAQLVDARDPEAAAVRTRLRKGWLEWALTTRPGFALAVFPAMLALSELDRERLDSRFREARTPFDPGRPPVRLSDLQGRLGLLDLAELDRRNARRRGNGQRLIDSLRGVPGVGLPRIDPAATCTFNAVAVRVGNARALARLLLRHGVDTRMDYMEWFAEPPSGAGEVLYLPNHPGLGVAEMDRVAAAVRGVLGGMKFRV